MAKRARQWRDANPQAKGNMRDQATLQQLLVMANLEGINAELIRMGRSQSERLKQLNECAIAQLKTFADSSQKLQQTLQSQPKDELE